jgi:cytidylate kinase
MIHLTISGLPGSGTTKAAHNLSKVLGWPVWNTGALFRQWAKKHKMMPHEFSLYVSQHPSIDKKLDLIALNKVKKSKKPLIYEGRLAGWLTKKYHIKAFRVWLWAPQHIRLKRVQRRDKLTTQEAYQEVVIRERNDLQRYKKFYGLDLRDLSIYDIVVNTYHFRPSQTRNLILKKLFSTFGKELNNLPFSSKNLKKIFNFRT